MKFSLLLVGLLVLSGCGPADPAARQRAQAERQERADRYDYQVTKLFEKDGCTVYSFYNNGATHHFTNCRGGIVDSHSRTNGKTTTHYDEEIPTEIE